jgi:hypothetical protein
MPVAGHFPMGDFLDGAVGGGEEGFCLFGPWHYSVWASDSLHLSSCWRGRRGEVDHVGNLIAKSHDNAPSAITDFSSSTTSGERTASSRFKIFCFVEVE